ncbi:hypothetical protein QMK50_04370 [Pseudomonas sp. P5_152]|uniref:hypothetical protein n=1 Tax=Pseudomonas sp. P5_152 TaxID=3043442 RepID=UPI002A368A97|nr:hypothetical protein [Pseudomonas sp. P5_152]MDX9664210.1 hypothetical protein [Pseudomonas sp. P5_152]
MNQLVVYDLTRLIARRNAETPTGIDRVDLRYALELFNAEDKDVAFVRQDGVRLVLLDDTSSREFIKTIANRWNHGQKETSPSIPVDALE